MLLLETELMGMPLSILERLLPVVGSVFLLKTKREPFGSSFIPDSLIC